MTNMWNIDFEVPIMEKWNFDVWDSWTPFGLTVYVETVERRPPRSRKEADALYYRQSHFPDALPEPRLYQDGFKN